jgi:hypothetical protein
VVPRWKTRYFPHLKMTWQRTGSGNFVTQKMARRVPPQSMFDLATVVAAWHQLPRATQQIIAALVRETTK